MPAIHDKVFYVIVFLKLEDYMPQDLYSTKKTIGVEHFVQGDPNQNLKFLLAITLKVCISDPLLVKPKCVWEASIYFENCKQTAEKL